MKAVDAEKTGAEPGVRTLESTSPGKLELPDYARALAEFDYTPEEERRILRKIDRRVVITLGCLYCVSLIDRVNLGAANIAGMGRELELVGNRYVGAASARQCFLARKRRNCSEELTVVCALSVHRHALLLRNIHVVPATVYRHRAKDRPPKVPLSDCAPLGRRQYWNGLRRGLGATSRAASRPRTLRGRIVPRLRLPAQHLVHEM